MMKHNSRIWYVISFLIHAIFLCWLSTVKLPAQVRDHARPIHLIQLKRPPVRPPAPPKPVMVKKPKPVMPKPAPRLVFKPKPVVKPVIKPKLTVLRPQPRPQARPILSRPAPQRRITPIQVARAAGLTPTAHAAIAQTYHASPMGYPNAPAAPTASGGARVPDMSAPPVLTANHNPYARAVIPRAGGPNAAGPGGPAGVSYVPRGGASAPTAMSRPRTIVGITRKAKLSKGRLPKLGKTAQEKRLHGTVVLAVTITPAGSGEIAVEQGSGYDDLDKAARDAVKKWAVKSAMTNGVATTATIKVQINFMSNGDVTGDIVP